MTDQEINHAIAEWLAAHGREDLAGISQWKCSKGHVLTSFVHGADGPLCDYGDDLLNSCLEPVERVFVPHNFVEWSYLGPAIEAWRERGMARNWHMGSRVGVHPAYASFRDEGQATPLAEAAHNDPMTALRAAFAAALGMGE